MIISGLVLSSQTMGKKEKTFCHEAEAPTYERRLESGR
jgi:hypothetical protein